MRRRLTDYHHVIWDWNGTLLNDRRLVLEIANEMLARRGLATMDEARYREIFDFPVVEYYRTAGFDLDAEPFAELADEFIGLYNHRVSECALHVDVESVLTHLHHRGLGQSILSAGRETDLRRFVAHYRLEGYFDEVRGLSDHYAVSKSEVGRRLVETLAVAPDRVVMIGDTTHDYHVASEMGVDCILVADGHQSLPRLQRTGAPVFRSLAELTA